MTAIPEIEDNVSVEDLITYLNKFIEEFDENCRVVIGDKHTKLLYSPTLSFVVQDDLNEERIIIVEFEGSSKVTAQEALSFFQKMMVEHGDLQVVFAMYVENYNRRKMALVPQALGAVKNIDGFGEGLEMRESINTPEDTETDDVCFIIIVDSSELEDDYDVSS